MKIRRKPKSLSEVIASAMRKDDRRAPAIRIPKRNQPRAMPTRTGPFTGVRQSSN